QKRLARASRAKLRAVWELLREHAGERCLVFTDDNDTAYEIGRQMVLPVLTHHTRPAERRAMLDAFRGGSWPVLVTSKVLNEGVDVPEASVGIIVSGSGSVREHVQRLGRILRPKDGKVAVLYELVSAGTAEGFTSERRRSHAAFGEMDWRDG
ncbi:MAG: ATP-dependent helicase, partial [Planctomycetes bacterium]|nr:ATP-dependent helicase [Planctomycetota bacterium]